MFMLLLYIVLTILTILVLVFFLLFVLIYYYLYMGLSELDIQAKFFIFFTAACTFLKFLKEKFDLLMLEFANASRYVEFSPVTLVFAIIFYIFSLFFS
jgi:hypothetical protein